MKMSEALKIIYEHKNKGYMVSFDHKEGVILTSDHFPDLHAGESLIETEDMAWQIAREFASATFGKCVNIYVIDSSFSPVPGYENKKIANR